jgi:hypothetical protein
VLKQQLKTAKAGCDGSVTARVCALPSLAHELAEPKFGDRLKRLERKIFWLTFFVLGLVADFVLPMWWALGATIPIFLVSWWVAYRSDWF